MSPQACGSLTCRGTTFTARCVIGRAGGARVLADAWAVAFVGERSCVHLTKGCASGGDTRLASGCTRAGTCNGHQRRSAKAAARTQPLRQRGIAGTIRTVAPGPFIRRRPYAGLYARVGRHWGWSCATTRPCKFSTCLTTASLGPPLWYAPPSSCDTCARASSPMCELPR